MRTTLQRLLRYPHGAVFDKSPVAELALRVRHTDGCVWSVSEETLTVVRGAGIGAATYGYDLTAWSLSGLASKLAADGFDVPFLSQNLRNLSAAVLIEGAGDQSQSNGDHLDAFTSILWVILAAHARELRAAGVQKEQALRQMVIPQAEQYWLDVWGMIYGVGRNDETDAVYAPRIPEEAFRLRVNALAIEKAILDLTGKDVRIREPWKEMFRLDISKLSGTHHMYDGVAYGNHLIQPISTKAIDWSDVLPIVDRNRAAGVIVLPPSVEIAGVINAILGAMIWRGDTKLYSELISAWASDPLGWMVLDKEGFVRNYHGGSLSNRAGTNVQEKTWLTAGGSWDTRTWQQASKTNPDILVGPGPARVLGMDPSDILYLDMSLNFAVRQDQRQGTIDFIADLVGTETKSLAGDAVVMDISQPSGSGINLPGNWYGGWDTRTWHGTSVPMS